MAITAAQLALMQPDDASPQIAQKGTVMANNQQGATVLPQQILHPFDGWQVHVICWLVKQEYIGFGV